MVKVQFIWTASLTLGSDPICGPNVQMKLTLLNELAKRKMSYMLIKIRKSLEKVDNSIQSYSEKPNAFLR
jgi:hypothetical protein